MRQLRCTFGILILATAWLASTASAEPIYVQAGPFDAVAGNTPYAVSWTQTDTWTDVQIALGLANIFGVTNAEADVFLTTSIGPGTTQAAHEIAAATLISSASDFQTITAFSGLTLGPGTYYLV